MGPRVVVIALTGNQSVASCGARCLRNSWTSAGDHRLFGRWVVCLFVTRSFMRVFPSWSVLHVVVVVLFAWSAVASSWSNRVLCVWVLRFAGYELVYVICLSPGCREVAGQAVRGASFGVIRQVATEVICCREEGQARNSTMPRTLQWPLHQQRLTSTPHLTSHPIHFSSRA